jgi:hypothetical protein
MAGLRAAIGIGLIAAGCASPVALGDDALAVTVESVEDVGCSTEVVLALSRQIADEVACFLPGAFAAFGEEGGLVFAGGAVLPYLAVDARDDLLAAVVAGAGRELRVTSAYRTVVQQYLLRRWFEQGRCGIAAAALPGASSHESGRAIDVGNFVEWETILPAFGWVQTVAGDDVHFEHVDSADDRGADVLAFQRLWNRNRGDDAIDEDGVYGPETEARVRAAPIEGFAIGACGDGDGDGNGDGDGGGAGDGAGDGDGDGAGDGDGGGCAAGGDGSPLVVLLALLLYSAAPIRTSCRIASSSTRRREA